MSDQPPLKPLHPESSLSPAKLAVFKKFTTDELKASLGAGQEHCLKARPDGTILDGHHRVHVLNPARSLIARQSGSIVRLTIGLTSPHERT